MICVLLLQNKKAGSVSFLTSGQEEVKIIEAFDHQKQLVYVPVNSVIYLNTGKTDWT